MITKREKGKKIFLASAPFFFAILILIMFSINANAVGTPTVKITISQQQTTCVLINASYNDTVTVPSSVGCGGISCATDPACCNPRLIDGATPPNSYSLITNVTNGGKTYLSRRCSLMPGIYDYNITGYDSDGNSRSGVATFEMVAFNPITCGDGTINPGEECDDRNHMNGDGCDQYCRIEKCGNGRVDPGRNEECDGADLSNQNCSSLNPRYQCGNLACNPSTCKFVLTGCGCELPNFCGDGKVDPTKGEQCDFGPTSYSGPLLTMRCSDINPIFTGGTLTCRNCILNTTNCVGAPLGGYCSDTIVEAKEQCESSNLYGKSCATFNFTGGPLSCNAAACLFNVSRCNITLPVCGDGMINTKDEVCDGSDLGGKSCQDLGLCGGPLSCNPVDCHFTGCSPCISLCDNSELNPGEECDGTIMPPVSCPNGGNVTCTACKLDYTGCNPPTVFCGNGVLDSGEQCDYNLNPNTKRCTDINPAFSAGSVSCNRNCTYNTSLCTGNGGGSCGNNIIEKGEECDGGLAGRICATFGFTNGTLSCNANTCQFNTSKCNNPPPYCGDGDKNLVTESCDGSDLAGMRCTNYSEFGSGTLTCTGDCKFDTSGCIPKVPDTCHNGQMDSGEECDDNILNGQVCPFGGPLKCTDCKFDYSGCWNEKSHCGNYVVDPCEQCDVGPYGGSINVVCSDVNPAFTPSKGRVTCNRDCTYNTSLCYGMTGGGCGDGYVAVGEQCEGSDVNGRSCSNFGTFTAGSLSCNSSSCKFDTCHCGGQPGYCSDGIKNNNNESCDGSDLGGKTCADLGFYTGALNCKADCHFDTSQCTGTGNNVSLPRCGDGTIQPERGEECDGSNLNGMDCAILGFAPGGSLSCTNTNCWYNTSKCLPLPDYCGNGRVDPCEQCDVSIGSAVCSDFGFTSGVLSCTRNCTINTNSCVGTGQGYCGDNILERGEQCDQSIGGLSCSKFSSAFVGGSLSCNISNCSTNTCQCTVGTPGPYCGDDVKNQDSEECDGTDLAQTCQSLGYASGSLKCSNCIINTSNCVRGSYCGDNNIQKPNSVGFNEECDNTSLGGMTCARQFGSTSSGTVTCRGDCTLEFNCINTPIPVCGDNLTNRELGEDCDGTDFDGETCVSLGYDHGTLKCNAPRTANQCKFDKSGCVAIRNYCGDRIVQPGEQCDGSIGGVSCSDFGFTSGTPSCNLNCTINTRNCVGVTSGWCGDNTLEVGEQCDGSVGSMTCSDFGFMSGSLRCVNCMINTSDCISAPLRGYCGDNVVQQPNGAGFNESCDGSNLNSKICRNFDNYTGGTLACLGDCSFDFSNCIGPPPKCGDGVRNTQLGEDCDLGDLGVETCLSLGYIGGTLKCNSTCEFDKSSCTSDPNRPFCGNGNIDIPNSVGFNEQCDGANLGGKVCSDFSGYTGGTLSCEGDCTFDYTACQTVRNYCGNYLVDPCEDCDKGPNGGVVSEVKCSDINRAFTLNMGTVRCTKDCKFNTSSCIGITGGSCSDSSVEVGEQCDGGIGSLSCTNISSAFNGGILSCNTTSCKFNTCQCTVGSPLPVCGDGVRNQDVEECDKLDLAGDTCRSLGYSSGTLRCSDDCKLDKTGCIPFPEKRCGDNIIQKPNDAGFNESCDGSNLNSKICRNFDNYTGGTLACLGDCNFDFSDCTGPTPPRCGDGLRNTQLGEDCDGTDLGGQSCRALGYDTGTLRCNSTCGFDKSGCQSIPDRPVCGDGTVQKPNYAGIYEDCDGTNLNGMACTNLDKFGGGTLACSGDCTFNTLDCWTIINRCGDGKVGACEQCDGTAVNMTCRDLGFTGGSLSCRNCRYDTSNCVGASGGYCGDGNVVKGEQCDGGVGSLQCADVNSAFNGGSLSCNANCTINTCQCNVGPPQPVCGDGVRNKDDEECDVSDLGGKTCQSLGYASGTLRCYVSGTANQCRLNTSGCIPGVETYCGDNIIQTPNHIGFNEQCEGTNLNGKTCTSFSGSGYTGGTLHCHTDCSYDYGGCTNTTPIRCGDNVKNQLVEDCDASDLAGHTCISQGFTGGILSCTSGCKFDKSGCTSISTAYCGDTKVQQPNSAYINESCDNTNLNGKRCTSFDTYSGGTLACLGDCSFDYSACTLRIPGTYCGDEVVQQPNNAGFTEDCDTDDLNGRSCVSLGYVSGTLSCTSGCRFDRSDCSSVPRTYCGDGTIQKPNSAGLNESCEGSNLNNRVCTQFDSYTSGTLACHGDCSYDYNECSSVIPPRCGDGAKNQFTEECDASDFGVDTCLSLGYINGSLKCTNGCRLDKTSCVPPINFCGDRLVEPGEQCDGSLGNASCRDFGFTGGYLSCKNCTYDTSACTGAAGGSCGDGTVVLGEQCDGSVSNSVSCRTFGLWDGSVQCANCKYNTSKCIAPSSLGYCGDGGVQKPNWVGFSEDCDGTNLNAKKCSDVGNYNAGTLKCRGDCTFDYSNCTSTRVVASCGDGAIQAPNSAGFNEQCDGTNLNSKTCSSFSSSGYTGGTLHCSGDCSFDYTSCTGATPKCGDSAKNQLTEECDGNDLGSQSCQALGYASGTLTCTTGCKLNKAGCVSGPSTYCGDSSVQQPNSVGFIEQCDGSSLNGRTCSTFSGYSGGTLVCHGDCSYDYSGCTNVAPLICGDNVKNRLAEDCDGTDLAGHSCKSQGYVSGTLSCTAGCKFDKSKCSSAPSNSCGDSVVQQPNSLGVIEDCDGADLNGETCISLGYLSGSLKCTSNCKLDKSSCIALNTTTSACGDGTIQAPNKVYFYEQCDSSNLNNMKCSNFDSYSGGNLACYGDCTRDYRNCTGGTFRCGDSIRNNVSEECDGADLAGQSCQTFGYLSGSLKCTSNCKLDKSSCVAAPSTYCGDGTIQAPNGVGFNEQCDKTNLNGNKCSDFGDYTGGDLSCHTGCSFDYSDCTGAEPRCSDNVKNQAVEECDASDFAGQTCKSLGYASGTLKCTSGCKLDKSSCVKGNGTYCGDGTVQKPNSVSFNEQCDGSNLKGKNCTDFDYSGGKLLCAGDCTFSYNNCTIATEGLCGDGVKNGQELCDKNDWGSITGCTSFLSFKGGTLSCLPSTCHFDTSKCTSLNTSQLNASCYDNQKDGDETDLDCGGSCFPCLDGKMCTQNNDCQSNNCKNNVCEGTSCGDSIKNGIETDVDCGGSCPQCELGKGCSIDSDCTSTFCNPDTLLCAIPACNDSFLNGDESDLDCGGGCPTKCSVGQQCRTPSDCQSGSCEAGLCSQDRNLDSDGDGMPDFWEDKYGLDKNNPDDANEDMDGDGYTNLQEYKMGSDPTDPNSPQTPGQFKSHTLQIILLIIGILFMAGGAGFLVYSRKVLIPQQKAATQKKAFVPPPLTQRPLLKRPLFRLTQPSQPTQLGRFVKKEGERKSLLEGFGKEKIGEKPTEKPETKPGIKPDVKSEAKPGVKPLIKGEGTVKPSAEAEKSDEFINISELGKKAEKSEQAQEAKAPDKKQPGDIFKKLKELSAPKKKK